MEPSNEVVQVPALPEGGAVEVGGAVDAAHADATAAAPAAAAEQVEGVRAQEPAPEVPVDGAEAAAAVTVSAGAREYPSLYDGTGTTLLAVALGIAIVGGIQFAVAKMYNSAKNEQEYLTRFVTSLVGLVMGAYVADLLIAGPGTYLMSPEEHQLVLGFVKDVAIMIFSFYFGSKAAARSSDSST